jgi:hypothetical protein
MFSFVVEDWIHPLDIFFNCWSTHSNWVSLEVDFLSFDRPDHQRISFPLTDHQSIRLEFHLVDLTIKAFDQLSFGRPDHQAFDWAFIWST